MEKVPTSFSKKLQRNGQEQNDRMITTVEGLIFGIVLWLGSVYVAGHVLAARILGRV